MQQLLRVTLLLLLGLLAVLTATPTGAVEQSNDSDPTTLPGFPTAQFADGEALVRDAYHRYEILAARSGAEVEFSVSNIRLLRPSQYHDHLMTDIRTFGGGWTLRAVSRTTVNPDEPVQEVTRLEPYWTEQPSWLEHSFPHVVGSTVAAIFEGNPEVDAPLAILTYSVDLSFDGKQRSYKACFYINSFEPLQFTIQDHVAQGMGYVYEDLPDLKLDSPELEADDKSVSEQSSIGSIFDALGGPRCSTFLPNGNFSFQGSTAYNSLEHSSGRHSSAILFDFECSCSTSCASFCQPSTYPGCEDHGALRLARVHVPKPKVRDISGSSSGGDSTPASCESTGVCAVGSCLDAACNSVEIGIRDLISVNITGETVLENWQGHRHICDTCVVVDDGSSGEGGGGLINDDGGDGGTRDPASPLIIDLDGRGFSLSSAEEGVFFDLYVNGHPAKFAWTMAGGLDAFLAIDLNRNGRIDSGYELFGDRSLQEPSDHPNGFKALAMYDRPDWGGNEDGLLSAADADWAFLRLWLDGNADGVTDDGELHLLEDWDVAAIDLDYRESERRDRHGNQIRYRSRIFFQHPGNLPHSQIVDVYLQSAATSD